MDSVTQIALGASVCYATIGPKTGRRALLAGAVVGTLPDMDVLIPYEDAVESFTYHRSWSHSLFVLSLASLPLTWLIRRVIPQKSFTPPSLEQRSTADDSFAAGSFVKGSNTKTSFAQWWFAIWLVLVTHVILDSFTIYGTQIWWPLPLPPVAIGSIFIIDPLYTIPLLLGCIIAWRHARRRVRWPALTGIAVSTSYLAWTLFAQSQVAQQIDQHLAQVQPASSPTVVIAPFPGALLWRVVIVHGTHYSESFTSLLDDDNVPLRLTTYPNQREACERRIPGGHWAINRMDWFTQGAIAISRRGERLIISDLRMGIEDDYVFEFDVGGWPNTQFEPSTSIQQPINFDVDRVSDLIKRITDPSTIVSKQRATGFAQEKC